MIETYFYVFFLGGAESLETSKSDKAKRQATKTEVRKQKKQKKK